jgi:hypothetical protein
MKNQSLAVLFFALNSALFLFIAAGYRGGSQTFDKITVKEFELVGEDGRSRATIKVETGGEVLLRMMDETGTIRVKVGAGHDGSGILLLDDSTEPGIHLLSRKGGAKLTVTDSDGKRREL